MYYSQVSGFLVMKHIFTEIIDGIERKKEMESSSIIWGDEPQKIRKEIEKSIY